MTARLAAVIVAGSPDPWTAVGFATDANGRIALGNGALEFVPVDGPGVLQGRPGLRGLRVDGRDDLAESLEGIPLLAGSPVPAIDHPNGCFELDHLVMLTADLDRSSDEISRLLGLPRRRMRETAEARQAFHRFGERGCILELVENARAASPRLFGVVANTPDLDRVAADLGDDVIGAPKPAVQPGRLIATFREAAGLGFPVALMTPET